LLPGIVPSGTIVGQLGRGKEIESGLRPGVRLTTVGSHDTASAVVAVPASSDAFAYISCGTWALVGVELERPVLGDDSRVANFTNERGVDGTYRYLRNVMGLWLLQESMRTWQKEGTPEHLDSLLAAAALVAPGGSVIDVDDPLFLPLGDIPARIAQQCRATDQPVPPNRAALVRCILDSLAAAFARTVEDARRLSGHPIDIVHIVGGGSQNELLCRLTANACGLPVVAGPVEATALGNVLVQARALGLLAGDLEALRALVRNTQATRRYEPETARGRRIVAV
jgi:rhamnulokinase